MNSRKPLFTFISYDIPHELGFVACASGRVITSNKNANMDTHPALPVSVYITLVEAVKNEPQDLCNK